MTDKELLEIREKIACPQFGDDHYGEWGALTLQQRKTILKLLDFVNKARDYAMLDFAGRLQIEIQEALKSNNNAILERIRRLDYDTEKVASSNFIHHCNGKIDALRGIDDFIDTFIEEKVGWYSDRPENK